MPAPLSTWTSVSEVNPNTKRGSRILSVPRSGNFNYLDLAATFDLNHFSSGHHNLVVESKFSDGVAWVARIHLGFEEQTLENMLNEFTLLEVVRERTEMPDAKVYAFVALCTSLFGFPYVLMERLLGTITSFGLSTSVPITHRAKVAKQIANVLLEWSQITFDRIGRLIKSPEGGQVIVQSSSYHNETQPMTCSHDYFYSQRYYENEQIYEDHGDDVEWNTASWILNVSLAHVFIPELSNGPFPICHQDLNFDNMLWDDDFNLKGVVDWGQCQGCSLEDLIILPDFALFTASEEILGDILHLKNLIVQALEEEPKDGTTRGMTASYLATYLASAISEIVNSLALQLPCHTKDAAKDVATFMFGPGVSWEQLVKIYGMIPAP